MDYATISSSRSQHKRSPVSRSSISSSSAADEQRTSHPASPDDSKPTLTPVPPPPIVGFSAHSQVNIISESPIVETEEALLQKHLLEIASKPGVDSVEVATMLSEDGRADPKMVQLLQV
jgi:hypothetical protein